MAEFGHGVLALDVDTSKVASAGNGRHRFMSPGWNLCCVSILPPAIHADYRAAARSGKLHFLWVEHRSRPPDRPRRAARGGGTAQHRRRPVGLDEPLWRGGGLVLPSHRPPLARGGPGRNQAAPAFRSRLAERCPPGDRRDDRTQGSGARRHGKDPVPVPGPCPFPPPGLCPPATPRALSSSRSSSPDQRLPCLTSPSQRLVCWRSATWSGKAARGGITTGSAGSNTGCCAAAAPQPSAAGAPGPGRGGSPPWQAGMIGPVADIEGRVVRPAAPDLAPGVDHELELGFGARHVSLHQLRKVPRDVPKIE
jgi:hypothetical protein